MSLPLPDLATLHAGYARGATVESVIDAHLARRAAVDDPGIFLHAADRAALLAQAAALPPFDPVAYPLWGALCAVKDNIDVAGMPTTAACPAYAYAPDADAPVVALLRAAGAIMVGKTNLDQFATGLVGVRTPYPVPRNAADPSRVPGGSSSGSAVAVAQGLATIALGTDTAGSGRVPAALNGIVGLKPSLGAVSSRGVVPACRSLDTVSIFALSVADAAAALGAVAAFDAADPFARPIDYAAPSPIHRLGVPVGEDLRFFGDGAAATAWEAAVARLEALDIAVQPVPMEAFFETARLLYEGPWVAERRAAVRAFMDANPEALHPVTHRIIAGADAYSAVDVFEAQYRLRALARQTEAVWAGIDALAVPTAPIFPTLAELEADPITPNSRLGTYTNFVNLLDLAAIAAPGPTRPDGLPAGVTFIAPRGADRRLAALAARFFPGVGGASATRSTS